MPVPLDSHPTSDEAQYFVDSMTALTVAIRNMITSQQALQNCAMVTMLVFEGPGFEDPTLLPQLGPGDPFAFLLPLELKLQGFMTDLTFEQRRQFMLELRQLFTEMIANSLCIAAYLGMLYRYNFTANYTVVFPLLNTGGIINED